MFSREMEGGRMCLCYFSNCGFFFLCVFCLVLILYISVTEILLFGQRDFEVFQMPS